MTRIDQLKSQIACCMAPGLCMFCRKARAELLLLEMPVTVPIENQAKSSGALR